MSILILRSTAGGGGGGGDLAHGDAFTVTGSGFGTKSGSAPIIWDQGTAAQGTIDAQWSGGWPTGYSGGSSNNNMKLQNAGFRSIAAPHQFCSKFYAGCNSVEGNADVGTAMLWKAFTRPALPYYSYWSWYQRYDPNWDFQNGSGVGIDNNNKVFDYSTGSSPYTNNGSTDSNWYLQFANTETQTVNGWFNASANDDGGSLQDPDQNGRRLIWDWENFDDLSPFLAWRKWEVEIKWSATTGDGRINWWMDGRQVMDYVGSTDKYSDTSRNEAIGGYTRNRTANQFRYFADVAYDRQTTGAARFLFTNNASLASSTIREYQKYTSWATGSVGLIANRGKLTAGTVHLHFVCPVNGNQYLGTKVLT